MENRKLVEAALKARENAYCLYSGFAVGAALLTKNGKVYTGCNVENADFGATNCAERTAFFKAVSEGEKDFDSIAIVGGPNGKPVKKPISPCGICRQVMMELCDYENFRVILGVEDSETWEYSLKELFPVPFGEGELIDLERN